jgi:alpha-tubulin suppressor-like RCC1 family protein
VEGKAGMYHSLAASKIGEIYTWGEGNYCRLGLGYDEDRRITLNQFTPKMVETEFEPGTLMNVSCGKNMTLVSV